MQLMNTRAASPLLGAACDVLDRPRLSTGTLTSSTRFAHSVKSDHQLWRAFAVLAQVNRDRRYLWGGKDVTCLDSGAEQVQVVLYALGFGARTRSPCSLSLVLESRLPCRNMLAFSFISKQMQFVLTRYGDLCMHSKFLKCAPC